MTFVKNKNSFLFPITIFLINTVKLIFISFLKMKSNSKYIFTRSFTCKYLFIYKYVPIFRHICTFIINLKMIEENDNDVNEKY